MRKQLADQAMENHIAEAMGRELPYPDFPKPVNITLVPRRSDADSTTAGSGTPADSVLPSP